MRRVLSLAALCGLMFGGADLAAAADVYEYDGVHSSVSFKARHLGLSWIHGRFNDVKGTFSIDRSDPTKSSFSLTIQVASVDTANKLRDEHLLQADYFDVKQYPTIEFRSTKVKPVDGGYEVTGDFTMHGTTKPVTFVLAGGQEITDKRGVKRIGLSTETVIKRSDFGFDPKAIGPIGDEALILIDCEGTGKQ
jgi:polyisoprenoid-binding protein YceI